MKAKRLTFMFLMCFFVTMMMLQNVSAASNDIKWYSGMCRLYVPKHDYEIYFGSHAMLDRIREKSNPKTKK